MTWIPIRTVEALDHGPPNVPGSVLQNVVHGEVRFGPLIDFQMGGLLDFSLVCKSQPSVYADPCILMIWKSGTV